MGLLKVENLGDGAGGTVKIMRVGRYSGDAFLQLYLDGNPWLFRLSGLEYRVLMCMLYYCQYIKEGSSDKGNVITLDRGTKDRIREACGCSDGGIRNVACSLVKKGLLMKSDARCCYYLNPEVFFKGAISARVNLIKQKEDADKDFMQRD